MNWRRGFFRAWLLISVIWVVIWAVVFLPGAESKIAMASLSDAELMAKLDECKLPPGVPPPPQGFILDKCLKRVGQDGRTVERWGGGNEATERAYRVVSALDLPILIGPPVCLLLFGMFVGWVLGGFANTKNQPRT